MFEDFFNHKCNIYHLEDETVNVGFGINASDVKGTESEPGEKEIDCHFHLKNNAALRITQKEPYRSVEGEEKLSLPFGTDIRMNDIVEDCRSGLKYSAGIPKEVHGGHHIIVTLFRIEEGAKTAI